MWILACSFLFRRMPRVKHQYCLTAHPPSVVEMQQKEVVEEQKEQLVNFVGHGTEKFTMWKKWVREQLL